VLRLVIFGRTGTGKSTIAGMIAELGARRGLETAVVKLAEPLYEIQAHFYAAAGRPVDRYAQDQSLLELIATQLRRISPTSLADNFLARLAKVSADVVINDDLRDPDVDYHALKAHGFRFIRVTCPEPVRLARLGRREDLTVSAHSSSEADLDRIVPDLTIDNPSRDLAELRSRVQEALERFL
jgi:dephospho-CoA kinase